MVDSIVDLNALKEKAEKYSIAITVENMRLLGNKVSTGTKKVIIKGPKDAGDSIEEMELGVEDHKTIQETVDKALITVGKADRHSPKGDINVNQSQAGTVSYHAQLPFLDESVAPEVLDLDIIDSKDESA
jgi:hypothetical protein